MLQVWSASGEDLASRQKQWLAVLTVARYAEDTSALQEDVLGTSGQIRGDICSEDLLRTLVGMCLLNDQPGWQHSVLRMVEVFVDGLRVRPSPP